MIQIQAIFHKLTVPFNFNSWAVCKMLNSSHLQRNWQISVKRHKISNYHRVRRESSCSSTVVVDHIMHPDLTKYNLNTYCQTIKAISSCYTFTTTNETSVSLLLLSPVYKRQSISVFNLVVTLTPFTSLITFKLRVTLRSPFPLVT